MERVAEKSEAAVALTKPAALLPTISIGFNYAIKTLGDSLKDDLGETVTKWLIPLIGGAFAFIWPAVSGMSQRVIAIKAWQAVGVVAGEAGIIAIIASSLTYRRVRRKLTKLERRIRTDDLTGFMATSAIEEILPLDFEESRSTEKPFSALIIHLDGLAKVREKWGAGIGEQVLKETAARLRSTSRSTDQIFRYKDSSQILIVAPATAADPGGLMFAQRLCKALQAHSFKSGDEESTMKVHVGIAQSDPLRKPDDTPNALLARADEALRETFIKGTLIEAR